METKELLEAAKREGQLQEAAEQARVLQSLEDTEKEMKRKAREAMMLRQVEQDKMLEAQELIIGECTAYMP